MVKKKIKFEKARSIKSNDNYLGWLNVREGGPFRQKFGKIETGKWKSIF